MLADIRPDSSIKQDFIDRNPVITNVQVVPDMSEHEVTPRLGSASRWIGSQTGCQARHHGRAHPGRYECEALQLGLSHAWLNTPRSRRVEFNFGLRGLEASGLEAAPGRRARAAQEPASGIRVATPRQGME
jgi:hypothetical protein